MREALNGFVIRGVASNIPFQAALLAHPKFVAGDFNTGFIAEHYAHGFRAEDVPHEDPNFLVALAAAAYRRYLERAAGISGQLAGHRVTIGNQFVVVVKGQQGEHVHVPVGISVEGSELATAGHGGGDAAMRSTTTGSSAASAPAAAATAGRSPRRSSATACGCASSTTACASTRR